MIDLTSVYRKLQWSRDQLAQRVLTQWKPPKKISHRSLSNQIAHLEKGDRAWWHKRPAAAQALVEVLGIDLEDLGLDRVVAESRAALPFHDFPAVRPFDPKTETACEIGNEAWFDFEALTAEPGPVWIHAPPGTGWTLLGEIYRQRFGVAVQSVRTLSEVTERNPTDWVVAQVRSPDEQADLALEEWWGQRGRVIICARFQPWEGRHGTPLSGWGAAVRSSEARGALSWSYHSWNPTAGWRERFISWLAGRVEGGPRFNVDRLVAWLNEHDPSAGLFHKPADVLALAGFAHEVGTRSWSESAYEKLPARWLAARITADPASARDTWLAGAAREAVIHAVHRWVESPVAWLRSQPRDTWRQWLLSDLPAVKAMELERHLAELDTIRSPAKRAEKKQQVMAAAIRPDPEGLFLKLEAERVLVPGGGHPGDWYFQPTWLAAWLGRQHIEALVASTETATWGRMAIFWDRQEMVDQALDRLDVPSFESNIRRAVASFDRQSLPTIAAVESLFFAAGRRLGKGEKLDRAALGALWERAIESLDRRRDDQPLVPLTRRGPHEGQVGAEWVEACWEWCQAIPKPAKVPEGVEWLFPGWFSLSFEGLPFWLSDRSGPSSRMVQLAETLIGSRVTGELRPSTPLWVRAPVLVARLKQGEDPKDLLRSVIGESFGVEYLLSRAAELGADARARLARELWSWTCSRVPGRDQVDAAMRAFINENLTESDLIGGVASHHSVRRDVVSRLSEPLRRSVVDYWLEHRPEELASFVDDEKTVVDGEVLDLVVQHLDPGRAARLLWKRDPVRALHHTGLMVRERPEEAQSWFHEGARRDLAGLLALLEDRQGPHPKWVHGWLTQLLISEPASAERIHALRLRARG